MHTKYIFVTGGVVSGLGKGITAASLGRLLKARGYKVTNQKLDPYMNRDPGTMSPYQHGEVFVTEDGAETDLDIGHYERFIDENLTINSNTTAGKIYWSVLEKERKGEYGGGTVQVIPHITNAIKERIYRTAKASQSDIVVTEIGGTVGDIESLPFLEAIRQVAHEVGRENILYIHVTLIPYLTKSGEMKTKPTQHSVKELLSIGIQPDMIVCRTEREMSKDMREKLALFCNVEENCIIQNIDTDSLYEIPLLLEEENFAGVVCRKLSIEDTTPNLDEWTGLVKRQKNIEKTVRIALVGAYVELHDAYLSVVEALNHAGIHNDVDVKIKWIDEQVLAAEDAKTHLSDVDGILVHGGLGEICSEGKVSAIAYARENKLPFFGICSGMQCAVVEFARHVMHWEDANGTDADPHTTKPVIDIMPEQADNEEKSGQVRLGAYPCKLLKDTHSHDAYNEDLIYERHRNRFEMSNQFRNEFVENGLIIAGMTPDEKLVEIVELPKDVHPWFVGVTFHPELKSRPNRAHPLFLEFVKAAL